MAITVDWSGATAVVHCSECEQAWGPWLATWEATEYSEDHRREVHGKVTDGRTSLPGPTLKAPTRCIVKECQRRAYAHSACKSHYGRAKTLRVIGQDLSTIDLSPARTGSIEGAARPLDADMVDALNALDPPARSCAAAVRRLGISEFYLRRVFKEWKHSANPQEPPSKH